MFRRTPKPPAPTREQSLAMRPLRMTDVAMDVDADGNGKLRVPMRPTRLGKFLAARMPAREPPVLRAPLYTLGEHRQPAVVLLLQRLSQIHLSNPSGGCDSTLRLLLRP